MQLLAAIHAYLLHSALVFLNLVLVFGTSNAKEVGKSFAEVVAGFENIASGSLGLVHNPRSPAQTSLQIKVKIIGFNFVKKSGLQRK